MSDTLQQLEKIIRERKATAPSSSYTARLFAGGSALQKRKIGEEAVEVIVALTNEEIIAESADLLFHLCVYLTAVGISLDDVYQELEQRMK